MGYGASHRGSFHIWMLLYTRFLFPAPQTYSPEMCRFIIKLLNLSVLSPRPVWQWQLCILHNYTCGLSRTCLNDSLVPHFASGTMRISYLTYIVNDQRYHCTCESRSSSDLGVSNLHPGQVLIFLESLSKIILMSIRRPGRKHRLKTREGPMSLLSESTLSAYSFSFIFRWPGDSRKRTSSTASNA